jgi:nitrite reductase/ring-hydroxylating ferredoxin subunit
MAEARHRVCSSDDLGVGESLGATVDGRPILLVRVGDGSFHALHRRCAHQGVDLAGGFVTGRMQSSGVGSYEYVADYEVVRCPRHGYQYDVRTGEMLLDPQVRIRTYPVAVDDNGVWVVLDE